jgi:hypothetical protein
MNTLLSLIAVIAVWLLTYVAGAVVVTLVDAGAVVVELAQSLYRIVVALVDAGAVVVKLAQSLYAVVVAVVALIDAGAVVVVDRIKHYAVVVVAQAQSIVVALVDAGAVVVALIDAGAVVVVDRMTSDLPHTSFYNLTVDVDSTQYDAGEYLVRDNGVWSNVYLTSYARRLMGDSVDVIALTPACVHDANGSLRVWHLAIA